MEFPKEMGLPGRIASRNITMDRETGIGGWTDGEKIRAIREGISRDGTTAVSDDAVHAFSQDER